MPPESARVNFFKGFYYISFITHPTEFSKADRRIGDGLSGYECDILEINAHSLFMI